MRHHRQAHNLALFLLGTERRVGHLVFVELTRLGGILRFTLTIFPPAGSQNWQEQRAQATPLRSRLPHWPSAVDVQVLFRFCRHFPSPWILTPSMLAEARNYVQASPRLNVQILRTFYGLAANHSASCHPLISLRPAPSGSGKLPVCPPGTFKLWLFNVIKDSVCPEE